MRKPFHVYHMKGKLQGEFKTLAAATNFMQAEGRHGWYVRDELQNTAVAWYKKPKKAAA